MATSGSINKQAWPPKTKMLYLYCYEIKIRKKTKIMVYI